MNSYIQKVKTLFLDPKAFFKSVAKEKQYFPILVFFVLFLIIGEFISTVFSVPALLATGDIVTVAGSFLGIVFLAIIAFAIPFIASALVHVGVMIVSGKRGFFNTFKPITYGSVIGVFYTVLSSIIISILFFLNPADLPQNYIEGGVSFSDLPVSNIVVGIILGIASFIHVVYAETVGIAYFHNLTTGKALISVLLVPLLIFLLFMVLIFVGAIAYFGVLNPGTFI